MAMKHASTTRPSLTAISFYTGAGGLDLGFEAAGFETLVAVENDPQARETLRINRPAWKQPDCGDALALRPDDLMKLAGVERGEIDALIGGPPCQPFSKSAFWAAGTTRRLNDPRARTLEAMLDFTEALLPRVLVIENVRGIAYREKDEAMQLIQERLAEINRRNGTAYETTVLYLHATNFGVPQLRERAFMIALRDGGSVLPPEAVSGTDGAPVPTAWDAIGNLRHAKDEIEQLKLSGKWADLLPSIPEGQNYTWHTDRGGGRPLFGWRTRYWSFLLKLAKQQPAWTIQASPGPSTGPFHWDNRLLSVAEMARLQTFPADYRFAGGYRSARRQIGNAVPPALAEAVAKRLAADLRGATYNRDLTLGVARLGPLPAPRKASAVPPAYDKLIGIHPAHPGTGKGPGAISRLSLSAAGANGGSEDANGNAADVSDEERAAA